MTIPRTLSPAQRGAYRKGYAAALAGKPNEPPYFDRQQADGRYSWPRAFSEAWSKGWLKAKGLS